MSENKRPDTQGWDTEAVRRRIISEVDAGTETGSKKKKHRKFNWKIYIAAVVLGSMLLAGLGWILANDLCALDKGNDTYTVTIEEGDGVFKIASKLKKAGLIELKGFFILYEIFTGAKKDIDPGTYELNTSMDYRSLVNNMYDPDARRRAQEGLVLLTIPEGYTVQQIVDLLAENKISTKEELIDAVSNFDFGEEYPFIDSSLNGQINRLEGYLFPDTYDFYKNSSPREVLEKMLDNFDYRFSEEMRAQIDTLNATVTDGSFTVREVTIVASLIEKETASASESPRIAGVIYNRLFHWDYPALLNIDAAIIYAQDGVSDHIDTSLDSPYNTYLHGGLPVGPICNPSLASIRAAVNPNDTDYYYFAYGKDGVSHFFRTFNEHLAFVNSDMYAPG